jgi:hypothetical protein
MADVDTPFGAAVYAALRRLSGFDCLTSHLDYAAIQMLKTADREGTARIFAACGPDIAAAIASAEPEDVANKLLAARAAKVEKREFVVEILRLLTSFLGP